MDIILKNQWELKLVTSPFLGSGWKICSEVFFGDPSPGQF